MVNGQTEGPSRALDLETSEPRLIVIVKAPELITSNYHNLELITSNCNDEEFVVHVSVFQLKIYTEQ